MNIVNALSKPFQGVMRCFFPLGMPSEHRRSRRPRTEREQAWWDVALCYDVREMTVEELAEMAGELYVRGLIPLEDVTAIIPFEESWDMTLIGTVKDDIRRDWLTEYRLRVDFGDTHFPELMQRLLGHLERVDVIRRRVLRPTVVQGYAMA